MEQIRISCHLQELRRCKTNGTQISSTKCRIQQVIDSHSSQKGLALERAVGFTNTRQEKAIKELVYKFLRLHRMQYDPKCLSA